MLSNIKIFLLFAIIGVIQISAQVIAWDFNNNSGDEITVQATTNNPNFNTSFISRGGGITPSSLNNSFSSTQFTENGSRTDAINNDDYLEFQISSSSSKFSLSTIDAIFRRSNSGPNTFVWRYSDDGTNFTDIGTEFTYNGTAINGEVQAQIDLSGINDLQIVNIGTTITIRLYAWGATGTTGTFAIGRLSGDDLSIGGEIIFPEPSNHVTNFTAVSAGPEQVDLSWNDNDGAQPADSFLIMVNTTGIFSNPVDGIFQADDTDLSDGAGRVNIASGIENYSFTNLTLGTQYFFKIFPYTNAGSNVDYKIDGTVPTSNATTALPNAWINEFHYDNTGTDEGEFVEVIIENPSTYNLADFQVDLYNGNDGASYSDRTFDHVDIIEGTEFIEGGKTFNTYLWGISLQNGPDGLSLSYQGYLIHFLSYEGTFTATNGPANGVESIDIGVGQDGSTPVGSSIGLTGTGTQYPDFTWTNFDGTATPGAKNGGQALPVELTSFGAEFVDNSVQLNWETATEVNNAGFEVERKNTEPGTQNSEWEVLSFIPGHVTTNSPKSYSYTDDNLPNADKVSYRLKQIDIDGEYNYSKVVEVDLTAITGVEDDKQYTFALEQNYPNPFNPVTIISYTIPNVVDAKFASTANTKLIVYNILGQQVRTLVNEIKPAGNYQVKFDGSNLPSGIYFYTLSYGEFLQTRKLVLLK